MNTLPIVAQPGGYDVRKDILKRIEEERGSKALLFVTGDRPGLETSIAGDVIDLFVEHLDALWPAEKITLILYTTGGNTSTAWQLINLLRTFCDDLEIIVLVKALSAGTLMCLGANRIVLSKQSTLGPIDPSLNSPLGPEIPNANPTCRHPVSVEAVQGYLDLAYDRGVTDAASMASVLVNLSNKIHPLVLGQIFRTRAQIRSLAEKLLVYQGVDEVKRNRIVEFLCSESGSHDHTINRREALELGLNIEKPSEDFYAVLKELYQSVSETLILRERFTPDTVLGQNKAAQYQMRRCLVESYAFGSHQFLTEGVLERVQVPQPSGVPAIGYSENRIFEAWRREA